MSFKNFARVALAVLWFAAAHAATPADVERTGGAYVPTPQVVVDQMLRMANVKEQDFVMDLGSGDGIIVLSAGQQYKAQGIGVEIDPDLVKLSNERARSLGIADRVRFVQEDVFQADLSKVSVLTLYLLPEMMLRLQSKLFNELAPGSRVVSHDYSLGGWQPDDQIVFPVPEKEFINGAPRAIVSIWYVPAKIAGTWQIKVDGGPSYELNLRQHFQSVDGRATEGGKTAHPVTLVLHGSDVSFALPEAKGAARFTGRISGNSAEGSVEIPGRAAPLRWSGSRTAMQAVSLD
jgi:phospholipid N-methyltransferase